MKKSILIALVYMSTITFSSYAQVVTKDSINILKQEKKNLEISKRLNTNKLKLAELQNKLQKQVDEVATNAKEAQNAAAQNQETAEKLNNDPQDKTLSKKSRKDAKRAESAAKAGRNATKDLKDLQDKITALQKEIAEDESRLGLNPYVTPQ